MSSVGPKQPVPPLDETILADALVQHRVAHSVDQLKQLAAYHASLYLQNQVMNLTRIPAEEAWRKQYLDAAVLAPLIPTGAKVLDIGTAYGVPAVVLAILRPDCSIVALDGSRKGLALIEAQQLPNVEVVQARAEDWSRREAFDVVTGRALAPLPLQLELSAAFAKVGGAVIPYRTSHELGLAQELPADRLGLQLKNTQLVQLDDQTHRLFPTYRKLKPTPGRFPRKWAEMKLRPLGET